MKIKRYYFLFLTFFVISCGASNEARKAFEQGDYAGAIASGEAMLAQDSTNADAWAIIAEANQKLHKPDAAIRAYEKVLASAPERSSAKRALVRLYVERAQRERDEKDYSGALTELKRAENLDPDVFDVYLTRAHVYVDIALLEKARTQLDRAEDIAKNDPRPGELRGEISQREQEAAALYEKGKELYARGRWTKARKTLEQATALQADHAEAMYTLHMVRGRLFYKKGSVNSLWDAISEFGLAANIHPERAAPHFYMAQAYEKKDRNEFDLPIETYQKVIALEPQSEFARKAQRRIQYLSTLKKKLEKFWGKKKN